MYDSTSRALALLDLLQVHGVMRGADIAARLEVDARTVRRYVMILRDRGVPVAMRRGRHGGYSLPPGYRQPLALTRREALALTYGLLGSGHQALGLDEHDAMRALRKVTRVLPSATRDLIGAIDGAVTFATPRLPYDASPAPDCLDAIVHAIQTTHQVRMRYHAQTGEVTERVVAPYQVVHRAGRWYLVGYCHLRADQRVFRLDHIQLAQELPTTFAPVAIDAVASVERSIAMTPWRWEFEVLAEAPLGELRKRIPATIAALYPQADGVLLRGFADDLDWLVYALAGLRCSLVIVRPDELRVHMRALAERLRDIAERSAPTAPSPSR